MVRDGYFYGISLVLVALVVVALTHSLVWAVLPLGFAAFFLWFFRDPERTIPQGQGLVVSPADGKVTSIETIATPEGPRTRISIFLNVFNVHVNRAPVAGVVREVRYQKGKFVNAMDAASADRNEQNICVMEADDGYQVVFKQIAGLLARRIVFRQVVGDRLARGQRVGLIKFGSRTDIILPADAEMHVAVSAIVKGGSTVLATVPPRGDLDGATMRDQITSRDALAAEARESGR
ncbi:phosphatidylserine decarboxylase family protein [Acidipila sp. EB88]|uniref:phosphatidylserine decarboxylase family protein n=1 Tax=Acidipila sp. EB88 TaxID=2305226 RepID=UPI000F5DF5D6|nr:phosphatidylserine decarboxylase family protein [Acidipila sp. EB88]RRA48894.1 phosphatidylserine decarboxylase family protein [Acidipila sp. EB88]